jgi:hypothetical protein
MRFWDKGKIGAAVHSVLNSDQAVMKEKLMSLADTAMFIHDEIKRKLDAEKPV